ncbi:MAG: hypothetical protein IKZ13_09620 [Akkermansia sp.]|nr:hypothetical protein [Akkermansia sp.]
MKIKILSSWGPSWLQNYLKLGDVEFTRDPDCTDYDWLVVYDEIPRKFKTVDVHCAPEHTILVTQEPPVIKVHAPCYTKQFHYMLTTHSPAICRHRGYRRGAGILTGMTGHPFEELITFPERPKSKLISAVCSRKLMTHTEHNKRHHLFEYLLKHLPDFSWKGKGISPISMKYEALDDYKYHIAVENTTLDYHWTEKIADSIMSLCLTFYSGDPKLERVLPPECFIRIPIDDPPKALAIIQEAIANNEYEKRLPAIREARRLLVERYNLYQQILSIVAEQEEKPRPAQPWKLYERHYMRLNPFNLLGEGLHLLRARLFH